MQATINFVIDTATLYALRQIIREEVREAMQDKAPAATDPIAVNDATVMIGKLSKRVRDMGVSVRLGNALAAADIFTLADAVSLEYKAFFKIRTLGRKCIAELTDLLFNEGLEFDTDVRIYGFTPHKYSRYGK